MIFLSMYVYCMLKLIARKLKDLNFFDTLHAGWMIASLASISSTPPSSTFSYNGKYLASSSKDNSAIIWEINAEGGEFSRKHKLEGHEKPVVLVLWSPDDKQVVTCGENEVIKRWDVGPSGQCLQTYGTVDVGSVSCGWLHDGSGIIGAMADRRIYLWNLDGSEIEHVQGRSGHKLSEVAMTSDGKWLVSVGKEHNEISLFDREARDDEKVIVVDNMVTSFSFSRDSKYLLVNLITQEIQVWMIDGGGEVACKVSELKGHKRRRFVIRSCFGGYDENFIASGSEDSQVYIWHRGFEREPCCVLSGHGGAVNCVSWNPTDLHMLASGSDDKTIRIWGLDDE
ncbi:transducin family protein / WD-40 repeat family protein [Raphanus sativus]|uniref:WD repeat-containing protein 26 homolog n=1 Tax=Raphanus sativus TaxID=3726 RepID=A0A6J0NTN3_RAPSA|nr:WD repeat-containing protein 26 homolog [Raphanus sativus]KAJ4897341.1 transducin family protein / WD-40 repeat family protein [Raphanus sativus]